MKVIKRQLSSELKEVKVEVISDWHLGDPNCNQNEVRKQVARIADNPHTYCIINGDIVDNAIAESVGDVYAQELSPMGQVALANELLKPIKDKVLCITGNSNHEGRTYRKTGINLNALLADSLELFDYYSDEGIMLFLQLGQLRGNGYPAKKIMPVQYSIYATHGSGGGATAGGKANKLSKLAFIGADIIIHSHTHMPLTFKEDYFKIDEQHAKVSRATQLFVNSSAMLNWGGYGENKAYKPSTLACPEIILNGSKKDYRCTI